ncbi:bifunctional 2-polyprenyl-6-hydroxyphenol methylase/3-demethylubiquinol 3-O-methyltransferase UbiG [Conexibacter sp. SYSU D00693]|uniref:class I SAM-dependent methyltransferase n=1 Tax=Conexibacter sp. SYSU D00693 TaxID=2812560 RepID=UPI00196B6E09|nr:methyltransferase domain-containing protein [Conexibacter sp. SYSU D00693]
MAGAGQRAARAHAYENPRTEVQALVPASARRILDLGCSSGALGAALKARQGAYVLGVEIDPDYGEDARSRLDEVIVANVEELAASEDLEERLGRFDCLLCADVLEHLVDPWAALERFGALVDPGGTLVVSLPNIRYWETFWQLGRHGTFPRRAEGIFDRTHLRWFTARDAWSLVEGAGFEVVGIERQLRARPAYDPKWDRRIQWLHHTPIRTFFTFQHLLVGRRRG